MADGFKDWEKVGNKPIGKGGFGVVWKVRTDKGDILAAKYIALASITSGGQSDISTVRKEVAMLKQLDHENVVKFVGERQKKEYWVVFTELIDGRDLAALGRLNENTAKRYLHQICRGLHYLHTCSPPVLHRDLKGQNIMVTRSGTVKLIDFGLAINLMVASGMTVSQAIHKTAYACGTLPFMAPELFGDPTEFSVKSDVWALGITIYLMLAGQPPFCESGANTTAIIDRITGQGAPPLPGGSELMKNFYACCTAKSPGERKSVKDLLQHKLLTGYN